MTEEGKRDDQAEKAGHPDEAAAEAKPPEPEAPPEAVRVKYDQFAKLQLKTAEILEAERVEGTDKLMKLQLALGEERRQIVAGIAEHYSADELVGKSIVVIANLKKAKIRGVESNGMLLAASTDDALRLVTVDGDLPSGSAVS